MGLRSTFRIRPASGTPPMFPVPPADLQNYKIPPPPPPAEEKK